MLLAIILIVILLIIIMFQKLTINNWIDPSTIMTVYWLFFFIGAFIVFYKDYDWKYWAELWLVMAILAFYCGHLLVLKLYKQKKIGLSYRKIYYKKESWYLIVAIILLGIVRTAIEMSVNGASLRNLTNLKSLIDINTSIAAIRYSGGIESTSIMQILSIFTYAAPLIGGYMIMDTTNIKERVICILTFMPILLSVLLTNGKAGFIASFFLFISGLLVRFTEKNKNVRKINKKRLGLFFLILIIVITILILAMMLRIGSLDIITLKIVLKKFLVYGFGHVQAFDNWFITIDVNNKIFGGYTFMAIFKNLGLLERAQGVYEPVKGVYSNVFTAYRGIIHDFGILGGIIFNLFSGMVSGYFYGNLKWGMKFKLLSRVIVAAVYFFIFYSFIISPWTYTSYILVFFIFYCYLYYIKKFCYII